MSDRAIRSRYGILVSLLFFSSQTHPTYERQIMHGSAVVADRKDT